MIDRTQTLPKSATHGGERPSAVERFAPNDGAGGQGRSVIVHILAAWAFALVSMLPQGCGSADADDPRGLRVAVQGEVTLDGKPLSRARITFVPLDGQATVKAVGVIQDGHYEIAAEHGPLVGRMRVEIQPEALELEEFEQQRKQNPRLRDNSAVEIPIRYNTRSELQATTVEPEADEANTFDFELRSK